MIDWDGEIGVIGKPALKVLASYEFKNAMDEVRRVVQFDGGPYYAVFDLSGNQIGTTGLVSLRLENVNIGPHILLVSGTRLVVDYVYTRGLWKIAIFDTPGRFPRALLFGLDGCFDCLGGSATGDFVGAKLVEP